MKEKYKEDRGSKKSYIKFSLAARNHVKKQQTKGKMKKIQNYRKSQ